MQKPKTNIWSKNINSTLHNRRFGFTRSCRTFTFFSKKKPRASLFITRFPNSQIKSSRWASSSFSLLKNKIVQMSVFNSQIESSRWVSSSFERDYWSSEKRKIAQIGDSNANCGGAAGYCLRVRKISSYAFYEHSLLFHLGILYRAGINETPQIPWLNFRVEIRR